MSLQKNFGISDEQPEKNIFLMKQKPWLAYATARACAHTSVRLSSNADFAYLRLLVSSFTLHHNSH